MSGLDTTLTINGVDATSAAFRAVAEKIDALQTKIATVNRVAEAVGTVQSGTGSFAPPGAALAEHETAVDRTTESTERLHGGVGDLLVATGEFAAAAVGLKTLADGVGQAVDQAHERVRMGAAGMDPSEVDAADLAAANLANRYPSIPQSEMMGMLRNARAIVGTYAEAQELADPIAKLRVVARGANSKASDEEIGLEFDQLLKGIEIKGATQDETKFNHYIEGIAKGLNAFGDTLKPYQYYEMFKYGRQATPALSEDFILGTAPSLAQELGGSSYGRAVSAFEQLIVAGVGKKDSFDEMARLRLVDKSALDPALATTGEGKGLKAGRTIEGWREAQSDPNQWVRDYLIPAMNKANITDKADQMREISMLFQNQMAGQMVGILATQQSRIDKDITLQKNAMGTEAADKFASEDPRIAGSGLWNTLTKGLAALVPADSLATIASNLTGILNYRPPEAHVRGTDLTLSQYQAQQTELAVRDKLAERFPGAFGPGVDVQDAEHFSRHKVEASYRYQADVEADPEAHRGAMLMGLQERQPIDVTGKVQLDPASKAEITLNVHVTADGQATSTGSASSSGNLAAHLGRMDTDASPRHRAGGPD